MHVPFPPEAIPSTKAVSTPDPSPTVNKRVPFGEFLHRFNTESLLDTCPSVNVKTILSSIVLSSRIFCKGGNNYVPPKLASVSLVYF